MLDNVRNEKNCMDQKVLRLKLKFEIMSRLEQNVHTVQGVLAVPQRYVYV